MLTHALLSHERHVSSPELTKTKLYPPGVRRILDITARDLKSHDAIFRKKDGSKWQAKYSLFHHHELDRQVIVLMCSAQKLGEPETLLSELSALVHDTGKIDKECWAYRLNRRLSHLEKMAVDTHSARTGMYISKLRKHVRSDDHPLIDSVHQVAISHHKPYLIKNPGLRQIGFNLKFADIFASRTEDRDRPGIPSFMAVEAVKDEMESLRFDPRYALFKSEIEKSCNTIISLFG